MSVQYSSPSFPSAFQNAEALLVHSRAFHSKMLSKSFQSSAMVKFNLEASQVDWRDLGLNPVLESTPFTITMQAHPTGRQDVDLSIGAMTVNVTETLVSFSTLLQDSWSQTLQEKEPRVPVTFELRNLTTKSLRLRQDQAHENLVLPAHGTLLYTWRNMKERGSCALQLASDDSDGEIEWSQAFGIEKTGVFQRPLKQR